MPASPRCAGDSRHTHPVPVTPDIGPPVASGWTVSSVHIATTPIRIPVLFCPHAQCRLPEPDRDQTRRQVHQAVTAPRRRQGCRAGARGGWHALANAATARQGTSQASNARPARTSSAPMLSRSRRAGAPRPSRLPSIASGPAATRRNWHRTDAASPRSPTPIRPGRRSSPGPMKGSADEDPSSQDHDAPAAVASCTSPAQPGPAQHGPATAGGAFPADMVAWLTGSPCNADTFLTSRGVRFGECLARG